MWGGKKYQSQQAWASIEGLAGLPERKKKTQVALCGHGAYTSFSVVESEEKPGRSLITKEVISCSLSFNCVQQHD